MSLWTRYLQPSSIVSYERIIHVFSKAKNIQTPKSKVLNGNRTNAKAENLSRTTTHYCKSNAYTFKPENPNQTNWSKGRESSPSGPMPNYRSQAEPRVSIGTQAQENRFQIKESLQRGQLYKLSLNMRSICLWQLTVDRETSKSTPPPVWYFKMPATGIPSYYQIFLATVRIRIPAFSSVYPDLEYRCSFGPIIFRYASLILTSSHSWNV